MSERPTRADLLAAKAKKLTDLIEPELSVLFCGINPGLYSAATGHHFARPGNRFWPTLFASGFTPRLFHPSEERELLPLGYGITEREYAQTGEGVQGAPQKWAPAEGGVFELWPVPDDTYRMRFRGVQVLPLMVNNSDRAVLDDTLLVLYAASELMKRQKLPDWEDKQREAQLHFTRLRSFSGGNKRAPIVMGGGVSGLIGDYQRPPIGGLDYMT